MGKLEFRRVGPEDADAIIDVQNRSFYEDFARYGACPAYQPERQRILNAICQRRPVYLIEQDGVPIGDLMVSDHGEGNFYLDCLCIVPEWQNKGLGGKVFAFLDMEFPAAKSWALETPADKTGNIHFYQKHGHVITRQYVHMGVEVVELTRTRQP